MSPPTPSIRVAIQTLAPTCLRKSSTSSILLTTCVNNGIFNMVLVSLGSVVQSQYQFSPTIAGLPYIAIGVGSLVGLASAPVLSRMYQQKRGSVLHRPEQNLILAIYGAPLTSSGLLLYGWVLEHRVFWFVLMIGLFVIGFHSALVRVYDVSPLEIELS